MVGTGLYYYTSESQIKCILPAVRKSSVGVRDKRKVFILHVHQSGVGKSLLFEWEKIRGELSHCFKHGERSKQYYFIKSIQS